MSKEKKPKEAVDNGLYTLLPTEKITKIKYPIGGFAPGNYSGRCVNCKEEFIGDKRAVQCEPCAINAVNKKAMTLKEQYKKETNLEVYILDPFTGDFDNTKYVEWLEAKINYTHSCTELKVVDSEDDWIEEMIDKETMSAEWRKENL